MIQTIHNYDSIEVLLRSLVALDIDNTVIKFDTIDKNWWKDTKEKYEEDIALEMWTERIKKSVAILIDEVSFQDLLQRIENSESELIFITARNESLHLYTMKHLEQVNLFSAIVYHNSEKGQTLLNVYQTKYSHLQHIIFVDDMMDNVVDVQDKVPNAKCYLLEHEKL